MFHRESRKQQSHIGSLIGVGTKITGNVTFSGGLRVDGEIMGNVSASGAPDDTLVVGEHGRLEGELSVSRLLINGTVIASTISGEFLKLQSRARITGDVHYDTMEMHPGAVVQGQLICRDGRMKPWEWTPAVDSANLTASEPDMAISA